MLANTNNLSFFCPLFRALRQHGAVILHLYILAGSYFLDLQNHQFSEIQQSPPARFTEHFHTGRNFILPPAARLTDMHVCPMVTPGLPPIPHVGGPIVGPGAPTVMIGFLPAANVGSMAVCVGPPDSIVKGSMGVMINYMPAARIGDTTAHGGSIVLGDFTVLIGETGSPGGGGAGVGAVTAGLLASCGPGPLIANASKYSKAGTKGTCVQTVAESPKTKAGRIQLAEAFYKQTGWPDDKIASHIDGIDADQPVELVLLPAGTVVKQWVSQATGQGNYFDGDSTPEELGIPPTSVVPRELKTFVLQRDTTVLRSTAAPVTVSWIPGVAPLDVPGGATQMFALPGCKNDFAMADG